MKIHDSEKLKLEDSVIAIGAFDGVHKGHQAVIKQMLEQSDLYNIPSVVYTFDQPPRSYFQGAKILSNKREKMEMLRQLGVDYTVVATFNEEYLNRSPEVFIEELRMMNPKQIIVGEDFRFGYQREGDLELLRQYFQVHTLNPVCCSNGERISSTRIRRLIMQGKMDQAVPLLI